jgi:ABC-type lipoprotein export system ATPase subunit
VAIARALINEPPLLLADEPTGDLDSQTGHGIIGILRRLHADGRTIVLVTHEHEVAAAADRIVELRDGRVANDGPSQPIRGTG